MNVGSKNNNQVSYNSSFHRLYARYGMFVFREGVHSESKINIYLLMVAVAVSECVLGVERAGCIQH